MFRFCVVVLLAAVTLISGCVVGYRTHSVPPYTPAPAVDLNSVSIAYETDGTHRMNEPLYSLEKAMRQRYRLFDIGEDSIQDGKTFIVKIGGSCDQSLFGQLAIAINVATFAAIPVTYKDKCLLQYSLVAPNGEERTFNYGFSRRSYSWLPFMFAGAGFFESLTGFNDNYQNKMIQVYDQISTHFLDDAASFLLSPAALTRPAKPQ